MGLWHFALASWCSHHLVEEVQLVGRLVEHYDQKFVVLLNVFWVVSLNSNDSGLFLSHEKMLST